MLLQSGHKITLDFIFCYQNKRDRLSSSEPSCFHQLLDKEPHSCSSSRLAGLLSAAVAVHWPSGYLQAAARRAVSAG